MTSTRIMSGKIGGSANANEKSTRDPWPVF
jgi:hypothetical protein